VVRAEKTVDIASGSVNSGDAPHELNTLAGNLARIKSMDPNFSEGHFLRGARLAFEMIVQAFASGDKSTLQSLLDAPLYDSFAKSADARKAAGQKMETTIVRLRDPDISAAKIDGDNVYLTVVFKSEQITTTRDADGKIVDGDPDRIYDITDIWTFRRHLRSATSNWFLTETQTSES
jgi:predicted lipid-binding transport protein (Tim44 family)